MTLTKVKPRRPSAEHRKRSGHHHRHSHDYLKAYWPYLPLVLILSASFLVNNLLGHVNRDVLGYATDMSIQSLADDTNQQRAGNGLGSLAINAALNQAAQAKANDMAARDYWSHNTPDGQTPWTFMTAAGYNYQTAGENLAYGFATAADTLTGWMNSPGHRANILNTSYREFGFGIINIPNYQGTGPETLVVAMYGSQPGASVAASTPAPAPKTSNKPITTPAPAAQPAESAPAPTPIATSQPAAKEPPKTTVVKDTVEPKQQRVTQLQLVSSNTPMNTLAVTLLGLSACAFLVLRHGLAWRKVLVRGEAFLLHHPLLDISAVSLVSLSIVLSHTVGLIR